MSEERKGRFGITHLLLLAGSIILMVSPSLVWFREEIQAFGEFTVKGSELGELAELMSFAGVSIFARGEYAVMLGAFALVLTLACFFAPTPRKLMGTLIGIAAIASLAVGIEPAAKLVGEGTGLGEGIYLLFAGSLLLLVGAIKLPSGMGAETPSAKLSAATSQVQESAEEPVLPEASQVESEPVTPVPRADIAEASPPASAGTRSSDTAPRPAVKIDGISTDRNRLVAVAIGLIILAIFSSVAFRLPEASTHITGGLFVGSVIKIVIAAIMLAMLLSVRAQLARLITYYARRVLKVEQYPSRAKASDKINGLSAELSNIVVIAIAWPLVAQIVKPLLLIDREMNLGWISIIVTLGFVVILLYRLYKGYQLLEPVLAVMGKAPQETSCPKCGTMNSVGAKFCISCGAELQPVSTEKATPTSTLCPKCGAENSLGARFCQNCGAPIPAPNQ